MNLLLMAGDELDEHGNVRLDDERARHLLNVLGVAAGDRVRVGVINGARGEATVTRLESAAVWLSCRWSEPPIEASGDTLLLGMPRPKVLARCLEHATALGFSRIAVFRTRRVVKSHFESRVLGEQQIRRRLLAGLEQSRRTRVPEFQVYRRFRPFVEDHVPTLSTPTNRFVADADATTPIARASCAAKPMTLVLGPEGGLLPHEIAAFTDRGFQMISAGPHPLRVEAALNVVAGQLMLLRERRGEH